MDHEDALTFIVDYLRAPGKYPHSDRPTYGYEVYLPDIMRASVIVAGTREHEADRMLPSISPAFYDGAWELCRRGVLRPGLRQYGGQSTDDGSAGNGYSLTPFGRAWLREATSDIFVPTEPERFGRMIAPFRERYGEAYHQHAQEAVRCYGAHAYLACCAMCGAAAESVMLAVAFSLKDEECVLKEYNTAQGRSRIGNLILGRASDSTKREFSAFLALLKYWRDTAGHGAHTVIADNEAYTSLAMLLRFSQYVADHWGDLVPVTS